MFVLLGTCVDDLPTNFLDLVYTYEKKIRWDTVYKRVDYQTLFDTFGAWTVRMDRDWSIECHRINFNGVTIYHVDHSRIDHLFIPNDEMNYMRNYIDNLCYEEDYQTMLDKGPEWKNKPGCGSYRSTNFRRYDPYYCPSVPAAI